MDGVGVVQEHEHEHEHGKAHLQEKPPQDATADPDQQDDDDDPFTDVPDGGIYAWMQVAGGFFLLFNSWGYINSFGVFQSFYQNNFLSHQTHSNIAWVGTIQSFFLLVVGLLSGPLFDSGRFRSLIFAGGAFNVVSMMTLGSCTEYWQVLLAQAFCGGIGSGFMYVPALTIVPQYFSTRRALATGIAVSGASCGGVIYPIMFRQLEPRVGFGWAVRIMGFVMLGTCAFSLSVMRLRTRSTVTRRVMLDPSAFKELPFVLFVTAIFFMVFGFATPIFYIEVYAIEKQTMSEDLAFYLVAILNASSVLGRVFPGLIERFVGPITIFTACAVVSAILLFCWIAMTSKGAIIAMAALYGFSSGAFISLPAVCLASITEDLGRLGTRIGMMSVFEAAGTLCGAPVSGAIRDRTGKWLGVQLYAGVGTVVTALFLLGVLLVHQDKTSRANVR
ncbi:hypothetical protein KEM52_004749 [Ascosphaera acerosa]|nr:hypothetical protein KEM52_004749 [Ascosphaera acerosa]